MTTAALRAATWGRVIVVLPIKPSQALAFAELVLGEGKSVPDVRCTAAACRRVARVVGGWTPPRRVNHLQVTLDLPALEVAAYVAGDRIERGDWIGGSEDEHWRLVGSCVRRIAAVLREAVSGRLQLGGAA